MLASRPRTFMLRGPRTAQLHPKTCHHHNCQLAPAFTRVNCILLMHMHALQVGPLRVDFTRPRHALRDEYSEAEAEAAFARMLQHHAASGWDSGAGGGSGAGASSRGKAARRGALGAGPGGAGSSAGVGVGVGTGPYGGYSGGFGTAFGSGGSFGRSRGAAGVGAGWGGPSGSAWPPGPSVIGSNGWQPPAPPVPAPAAPAAPPAPALAPPAAGFGSQGASGQAVGGAGTFKAPPAPKLAPSANAVVDLTEDDGLAPPAPKRRKADAQQQAAPGRLEVGRGGGGSGAGVAVSPGEAVRQRRKQRQQLQQQQEEQQRKEQQQQQKEQPQQKAAPPPRPAFGMLAVDLTLEDSDEEIASRPAVGRKRRAPEQQQQVEEQKVAQTPRVKDEFAASCGKGRAGGVKARGAAGVGAAAGGAGPSSSPASKLLRLLGSDSVDVSVVNEMLAQGMSEDEVRGQGEVACALVKQWVCQSLPCGLLWA